MALSHLTGAPHGHRRSGIRIAKSHRGLLHKALGIPQGQKIPRARLQAAARSSNPTMRKRAQFALNAASWQH